MENIRRMSFRYGDGTIFYRYYYSNSSGRNMRPVTTWTTSTIAERMFGISRIEETQPEYDFDDDLGDALVGHTLLYIRNNPGCTDLDWDVISEGWKDQTGLGREIGVLKLRFGVLKKLYPLWMRFERYYPDHRVHFADDEWWTTACPPEFQRFNQHPMSFNTVHLLAQVPTTFMG